jgi:hypothetical protein
VLKAGDRNLVSMGEGRAQEASEGRTEEGVVVGFQGLLPQQTGANLGGKSTPVLLGSFRE